MKVHRLLQSLYQTQDTQAWFLEIVFALNLNVHVCLCPKCIKNWSYELNPINRLYSFSLPYNYDSYDCTGKYN